LLGAVDMNRYCIMIWRASFGTLGLLAQFFIVAQCRRKEINYFFFTCLRYRGMLHSTNSSVTKVGRKKKRAHTFSFSRTVLYSRTKAHNLWTCTHLQANHNHFKLYPLRRTTINLLLDRGKDRAHITNWKIDGETNGSKDLRSQDPPSTSGSNEAHSASSLESNQHLFISSTAGESVKSNLQ
jgi:hypothetical protein